jgi:hypothetical protein
VAEKVVADTASKEKKAQTPSLPPTGLSPVQTMPPPAAPARKDHLKSAKAPPSQAPPSKAPPSKAEKSIPIDSEDSEDETGTIRRVANVPSGSKTTNDDVKRSVKELFPRLTGK